MVIIGLTGRACAGKDQYAQVFEDFGCTVVNVDHLGHDALKESVDQLQEAFGPAVVHDKEVDRKALGALVFSDTEKLRKLESIVHPRMVEACRTLIAQAEKEDKPAVILNAALLKRMGLERLCDQILFVHASRIRRYFRCKGREGLSFSRFWARELAQKDIVPKSDDPTLGVVILSNRRSKSVIHRQVTRYCDTIGIRISSNR